MLAIRDENIVNAAQAARQAQGKGHLAPKTPGARFPKTPSRIVPNDENAVGGKTVLGKAKGGMNHAVPGRNLVTPSETQARAPLGNKTTNAKARTGHPLGVKDIVKEFERTQTKQTTVKKPKQKASTNDPLRVSVHNGQSTDELDIEYAPPKPRELPYESDVFPDRPLTFEGLKPGNLFKGYYNHFYNPMGEDGMRLQDRKHEQRMRKALKQHDVDILRDIEAMDWSISDMPELDETTAKEAGESNYPPTINSRKAASALSMPVGSTVRQRKAAESAPARRPVSSLLPGKRTSKVPIPTKAASGDSVISEAVSRSTLGYTKGRSASSLLTRKETRTATSQATARSKPTSVDPNATIVWAPVGPQQSDEEQDRRALPRLEFLSIFDPEDDEPGDFGAVPEFDDEDEEFELKLET
ncbi:hypothetical protein SODALDRAFT_31913 [Sodiomyces alkalinus F11]|uniref:Uncharacterized protein n=1 Tax=Sodiomyces alkalinus (strain CBS 110278 / VKM F-3762 / F11) TaxID=1314773 RepID=A0A3N2Q8X7_SODAK|nr:hypothetical protein SODALDRAFT_31913 [Sodiomyces alkalinus F11]ROT43147.1 hypothetical protein SODALDRAFT_31913 [Sodiomyces alkalinus F11]